MSRSAFGILFLAVTIIAVPTATMAAGESERPTIVMRTGEHATFDRLVFDAPRGAHYKLVREKTSVTLSFSLAAKMTVRPLDLARARGLQLISSDPLAIRFTVAPDAELKDFMSDSSVVIDVTGAPLKPEPSPAVSEKPKETKALAPKLAEVSPVAPPPAPPVKAPESNPSPPSTPAVHVPAPQPPPEPPVPAPVVDPATVAPVPKAAPVPTVQEGQPIQAAPKPVLPLLSAADAKTMLALAQEKEPQPILSVDPTIMVGAAIYQRAGAITFLFDRKITLMPEQMVTRDPIKAEPINLPYNTGYRIAVPDSVSVRATREGTAWKLYLTQLQTSPGITTEFVAQPEFALGARLLLPTANPPDPIFYTDPVVGDVLLVLPLRETSAFTVPRAFADFEVLPAAQGLVLKPWHEKIVARIVPDGIEITSEGGLKLSPPRDTGAYTRKAEKNDAPLKKLFDLYAWRGRVSDTFTDTRQKLMRTIIDVPEEQRVLARLDLARFYFAHGMGKEAVALLGLIQKSVPEIEGKMDFLALRGAARILAGDSDGGTTDLAHPLLADQPEATLWRAIGSAYLRQWDAAIERFQLTFSILDSYPEPFRSRFMVLAVEAAVVTDRDKEAAQWLSHLESGGHDPSTNQAVLYLRGVLDSKAGRSDLAGKRWREVAEGPDRLYKIRAELALVDLGVATKSITPKQAVDRLEGLRFAWRGDNLEFDILRRLGGFYLDAKDYHDGLLVYGQALRLYPTSPQAPQLKAEMKQLFRDVFLSPVGEKLAPLEALALYSDFKALTPDGDDGIKVRRNLAERLVDIDLLDQAGNILADVIKSSDKPEERVQTATRLAAVRLLDHQPATALDALNTSQPEAALLSGEIQNGRSLLRARALSELGNYDEAIAALPTQQSDKATLLRADIALRAKQWDAAAQALLSLVGTPPAEGQALSDEKAKWVTNIALALAQGGDADGLHRLADAFGSAMDKTGQGDLFRLLTRPEQAVQLKDIAAAQARLTEVDMFKNFLETYRKNEVVDEKMKKN